jgi:hypothetical protein
MHRKRCKDRYYVLNLLELLVPWYVPFEFSSKKLMLGLKKAFDVKSEVSNEQIGFHLKTNRELN